LTRQKQGRVVNRKQWGAFNPRKSIGKNNKARGNSKEAKTRTGMRINRLPVPKKENEDPILALLQ
jgi:hypothetical protein